MVLKYFGSESVLTIIMWRLAKSTTSVLPGLHHGLGCCQLCTPFVGSQLSHQICSYNNCLRKRILRRNFISKGANWEDEHCQVAIRLTKGKAVVTISIFCDSFSVVVWYLANNMKGWLSIVGPLHYLMSVTSQPFCMVTYHAFS